MATPNLPNSRTLTDANLTGNVAVPAASSTTVYSPIFDLGNAPYSASELYNVEVDLDPQPNNPAGGAITVQLQDSADGVNFAAIPQLANETELTGNSAAVTSLVFKLPPSTREYIRAQIASNGSTGTNLAGNVVLSLKF